MKLTDTQWMSLLIGDSTGVIPGDTHYAKNLRFAFFKFIEGGHDWGAKKLVGDLEEALNLYFKSCNGFNNALLARVKSFISQEVCVFKDSQSPFYKIYLNGYLQDSVDVLFALIDRDFSILEIGNKITVRKEMDKRLDAGQKDMHMVSSGCWTSLDLFHLCYPDKKHHPCFFKSYINCLTILPASGKIA